MATGTRGTGRDESGTCVACGTSVSRCEAAVTVAIAGRARSHAAVQAVDGPGVAALAERTRVGWHRRVGAEKQGGRFVARCSEGMAALMREKWARGDGTRGSQGTCLAGGARVPECGATVAAAVVRSARSHATVQAIDGASLAAVAHDASNTCRWPRSKAQSCGAAGSLGTAPGTEPGAGT